ncbi:MAG: arginine--tRNA ligase [Desulfurococcales archaeon]|nr:arginine--tRNA ligase [Desulfurococcales archaeon]
MEIPEEPFSYVAGLVRRGVASFLRVSDDDLRIEIPPRPELGDLAIPLHGVLKKSGLSQGDLEGAIGAMLSGNRYVRRFSAISGYLDIWLDVSELARVTFRSIEAYGEGYGVVRTREPRRYVVEYVSANPVHPLHIGSGRNAALGIAIASMLRLRGHVVETRFYVNDMGRQVAIMVLGFMALGMPDPPEDVKEDHWIGYIYASTNVILEILSIKRGLEELREKDPEGYMEKLKELDSLLSDAARLSEKHPQIFNTLMEKLSSLENPEEEISRLMASYEKASDPEVIKAFRGAVELCLRGFRKTLSLMGAEFDKWDFESDLAWEGIVEQVIQAARSSKYYGNYKGAPALIFNDLLRAPGIREELRLPKTLEIPPLILMRSDETTLYTVRDIGYSIKKFRESGADYVINIIASEQLLPQAQLRLALYALGYKREASNLIHYSYEIVSLPGQRMSGRRGRYVTLDEVLETSVARSMEILRERGSEGIGEHVANVIGVSAVKYSLVSVSASKPMVFKIEDALNFERNSAPYIMYTYARASSILEKAGKIPGLDEVDYSAAEENQKRRQLLIEISRAPTTLTKAIDELKPEDIASMLIRISDLFNSWYQEDQVIREPNPGVRAYKVHLVRGVRQVLGKGLKALGINPIEKI